MVTPTQFVAVKIAEPPRLTPDEIVGAFFCSKSRRGRVVYRFDRATFFVVEFADAENEADSSRLMPLAELLECRFYATEEELNSGADGAGMEAER